MAEERETPGTGVREPGKVDMKDWKPGSEAAKAKDVGAEGDFGVPVGSGPSRQREYVTQNTKMSDPGAAKPRSGEVDGVRTSGAGWTADGDGAGSEGDIDTDVLGLGAGGTGIAAEGPGDAPAPDDSDGTSNEMASPLPPSVPGVVVVPASGRNQTHAHQVGGSKAVRGGTTFSRDTDMQTGPQGQGADAATNPAARGDDSFAGEVSSGEAAGGDLSMAPSQETQGLVEGDNQTDGNQKDFDNESLAEGRDGGS